MNASTNTTVPKGILANLKNDFTAAISVSLVALPLSLGIAVASGVAPMSGLLAAIIGGFVTTLFRGGHLTINGPAAGLIAAIFMAIGALNDFDASGALVPGSGIRYTLAAIMVAGGLQVFMGFFKLGRFAEIFPSSVISGILAAIGVIIFGKQIHQAMGTAPETSHIVDTLLAVIPELQNINPVIALISILGVGLLIFHSKISYKLFHFLPAPMWVLLISIPLVYYFNFFESHEFVFFGKTYNLGPEYLIDIPSNPLAYQEWMIFPDFGKIHTYPFWLAVISITLIGSITTLVCAKAVDKLDPYKRKTDLNKDLMAVGLSSIVSAAIGGLPIIAVIVRSTVNIQNNARTKWSNFYHGFLLLVFVLLLADVISMVPLAALAAILVFTGFKLASPKVFKDAYEKGMEQFIFVVTTLVITLQTDQLWGIIGGIAITLIIHILLSRIPVRTFFSMMVNFKPELHKVDDKNYVLDIKGVANFIGLLKINPILNEVPSDANLIIDCRESRLVDLTVLETFYDFKRRLDANGGSLQIKGLDKHVSSSKHKMALRCNSEALERKLTERQEKLKSLADTNKASFKRGYEITNPILHSFDYFNSRTIELQYNFIQGNFANLNNVNWEVSDLIYDEGALMAIEVYHTTILTLELPFEMPKFIVDKEGFLDKLVDRFKAFSSQQQKDFNMFMDYSDKFVVQTETKEDASKVFTPDFVAFLESDLNYHIECNGKALYIFRQLRLAKPTDIDKMIQFSESLLNVLSQKNKENLVH